MTEGPEFLYEFGPFALDGRERVLMREGQPVPLAPKAVDILLVLVRNSGHLVGKDQLMSEVWPSTYVEEANLTQNISVLRKVLSEGGKVSNYIETVPRRGYRFLVSVRKISGTPRGLSGLDAGVRNYRMLAILPFVNASGDERMDYLSAGITESIINSISQLQQLRVMSRNAVFRYREKEIDAQSIGRELQVDAVLVGQVKLVGRRLQVSAELVDVADGWQLWGDTYDRSAKAILEVQEEIARQISTTLRLRLTGDDERRLTQRFTESGEAYQAYLQARYHWSRFTREGLQQATIFFRQAIELDSNYALAYAGIVDCYLRLATNYIPPSETQPGVMPAEKGEDGFAAEGVEPPEPVKTRYKWDWTGVERELKRAAELKSNYPAAHQWQAAYLYAFNLFRESLKNARDVHSTWHMAFSEPNFPKELQPSPTQNEEIQIHCAIAREQIEVGNFEAGYAVLKPWWSIGEWPNVESLHPNSAADLLFTTGTLAGCITSSRQVRIGQKFAEALLNRAIGLFENAGSRTRSAEARIELACCYYREGLFDLARTTLTSVLGSLTPENYELKSLSLIRLAVVERHAGRLTESLNRIHEASEMVEITGPWVTGRYHQEFASTLFASLKDLAAEEEVRHFDLALGNYRKALRVFEAVGNHRYAAVVENNRGFMLLAFGHLDQSQVHLSRARRLFEAFCDRVRTAQVDETLARLEIAKEHFDSAEILVDRAIETLEKGDEEALLAEALTTKGLVLSRQNRFRESKGALAEAYRVAERCGDWQGASRAICIVVDEMLQILEFDEATELAARVEKLLAQAQLGTTRQKLQNALRLLPKGNADSPQ